MLLMYAPQLAGTDVQSSAAPETPPPPLEIITHVTKDLLKIKFSPLERHEQLHRKEQLITYRKESIKITCCMRKACQITIQKRAANYKRRA